MVFVFLDKMKDSIVAKVAMQAADYYQEAVRAATHYEVKSMWEKVVQLKLIQLVP